MKNQTLIKFRDQIRHCKSVFKYMYNFPGVVKVPVLITLLAMQLFYGQAMAKSHPPAKHRAVKSKWVGTWATARQLIDPANIPPAPGLSNNTLRQVVCVSIGGKSMRLKVSNEFGKTVLSLKSIQIAVSKGLDATDSTTSKQLTFSGRNNIELAPGAELFSDPVSFDLKPRMQLAITITFGETPQSLTGHSGSRTTSYLLTGQQTTPGYNFAGSIKTDHWYVITGIDVSAAKSPGSVVVFGDSITDGRGSGTNKQDRWTDVLSVNLLQNKGTKDVGVLNMGIGGNAVLRGGLGPTGLNRFEHDVLKQSGVSWLIIFEGVNDLGGTRDSLAAADVAKRLIAAYDQMISQAHAEGIKVFGATITPFKNNSYYKPYREAARNTVNEWIRASGHFDAVIDFDKTMRDPAAIDTLLPELQAGANDYLHPNESGYKMMGDAVDLSIFSSRASDRSNK